jgi:hypothetical protein
MSIYLYELPTTGAISFADFSLDENASYTSHISEVTQARANLRGALKESKRADGEKDFLKLVKVRILLLRSNLDTHFTLWP